MKLLDAIAKSVEFSEVETSAKSSSLKGAGASQATSAEKPVMQLNPLPVTIDTNTYKNPKSNSNPNGDMRSLYALRNLVDPVPTFSHDYAASSASTESVYKQLIYGASAAAGSTFAAGVISDAQKAFEDNSFADLDGTSGTWRPVYAVPEDWYDLTKTGRFKDLDIDLTSLTGTSGTFSTIGGEEELAWQIGEEGAKETSSLDSKTQIRSVKMKYLLTQFRRPWFSSLLFDTDGWYLGAQRAGFCSSGRLDVNQGVLPLISTGMLLAKDVTVDADWSKADQKILAAAKASGQNIFLGPFLVDGPEEASSSLQLIGWVSNLVPFSPQVSTQVAGTILVKNSGGFIARFSVKWREGSQETNHESGNFPVLSAKDIEIFAGAAAISVKIEIMTFIKPFETWKTVATYQFDKPVTKTYELSGTTFSPKITEL